jgi:hypothetical protein
VASGVVEPLGPPRDSNRSVAAAGVVVAGLLLCWAIWQPEASNRTTNDALDLAHEREFTNALVRTEDASDANPLSPDPYLVRASVETQADMIGDARRTLEDTVLKFPGDPKTWHRLAAFQLGTLDNPAQALETLKGALYLDPHSATLRQLFLDARRRQREEEATGTPASGGARANGGPGDGETSAEAP